MRKTQAKHNAAITFDRAVAVDKAVQRFGEFTAVGLSAGFFVAQRQLRMSLAR